MIKMATMHQQTKSSHFKCMKYKRKFYEAEDYLPKIPDSPKSIAESHSEKLLPGTVSSPKDEASDPRPKTPPKKRPLSRTLAVSSDVEKTSETCSDQQKDQGQSSQFLTSLDAPQTTQEICMALLNMAFWRPDSQGVVSSKNDVHTPKEQVNETVNLAPPGGKSTGTGNCYQEAPVSLESTFEAKRRRVETGQNEDVTPCGSLNDVTHHLCSIRSPNLQSKSTSEMYTMVPSVESQDVLQTLAPSVVLPQVAAIQPSYPNNQIQLNINLGIGHTAALPEHLHERDGGTTLTYTTLRPASTPFTIPNDNRETCHSKATNDCHIPTTAKTRGSVDGSQNRALEVLMSPHAADKLVGGRHSLRHHTLSSPASTAVPESPEINSTLPQGFNSWHQQGSHRRRTTSEGSDSDLSTKSNSSYLSKSSGAIGSPEYSGQGVPSPSACLKKPCSLFPKPAKERTLWEIVDMMSRRHREDYYIGWTAEKILELPPDERPNVFPVTSQLKKDLVSKSVMTENKKLAFAWLSRESWAQDFRHKLLGGHYKTLSDSKRDASQLWRENCPDYDGSRAVRMRDIQGNIVMKRTRMKSGSELQYRQSLRKAKVNTIVDQIWDKRAIIGEVVRGNNFDVLFQEMRGEFSNYDAPVDKVDQLVDVIAFSLRKELMSACYEKVT